MQSNSASGKVVAYGVMVAGGLLLLAGLAAAADYLGQGSWWYMGLPGVELGPFGTMALGFIGGGLALYHGYGAVTARPSPPLVLPRLPLFALSFALVVALGSALLLNRVAVAYLFPPLFVLGAALPPLGVVAWAAHRLGRPLTVRQAVLALVCGGTLSVVVAVALEGLVPALGWIAFYFLPALGDPSRPLTGLVPIDLIVFLVATALVAPLPEEFAKVLGLPLFGRRRLHTAAQALAVGVALGAGFAIVENMLYEGTYASYFGWSWAGVTVVRGFGGILHPVCTGLVALGVFQARTHGAGRALAAYAAAVGLHTLWNGGFTALLYVAGIDARSLAEVNLFGTAIEWLLAVYLVLLALALWWLLARLTRALALQETIELQPAVISTRALAAWAAVCALVIIPLGVALGSG